jgi:hypothetical protein
MQTTAAASLEYKNDFLSITIVELKYRAGTYNYSIGLNLPKFNPIIYGRTGICSNAAFKGLQQLRADVSHYANERGVVTRDAGIPCVNACGQVHGWYQESDLIIENTSLEFVTGLLKFSAHNLVQTIMNACAPEVKVPEGLDPAAMQRFLESQGVANFREAAPAPIAKAAAA